MGVTASQIRQDLSCFGEFGQQGYGYNIMELRAEIGHILGVDDKRRLIVVGAGHLGHALLQNFDFDQGGFLFDTAFDVSPAVIGTTSSREKELLRTALLSITYKIYLDQYLALIRGEKTLEK